METSLVIKSKSSTNKSITKSVTNINPEASDANLYTFAVDFNNLSVNSFDSVSRVDKRELVLVPNKGENDNG